LSGAIRSTSKSLRVIASLVFWCQKGDATA
jgi:hypothetical protein